MSGSSRKESLVHRRDDTSLDIDNPYGVPITLFANRDVPVEMDAVDDALAFVSLQESVEEIWTWEQAARTGPFWGDVLVTDGLHGSWGALEMDIGRVRLLLQVAPAPRPLATNRESDGLP